MGSLVDVYALLYRFFFEPFILAMSTILSAHGAMLTTAFTKLAPYGRIACHSLF